MGERPDTETRLKALAEWTQAHPNDPGAWDALRLADGVLALLEERDALREALAEIETYPVGDDGYQDIARAALNPPASAAESGTP